MKIYMVCIIFLLSTSSIYSQEELKFNNFSFGTSFDIIARAGMNLISLDRRTTTPAEGSYKRLSSDTVAGYQCTIVYIFSKNNLIAGYYSVYDNDFRSNDFILYNNAYDDLRNRLVRVYGNPIVKDESIPIDQLNHKIVTKWTIGNDVIELQVFNSNPRSGIGNSRFRLYIFYKSKQYIENELINERNRNENLDGL
jgi:hypothetical protein